MLQWQNVPIAEQLVHKTKLSSKPPLWYRLKDAIQKKLRPKFTVWNLSCLISCSQNSLVIQFRQGKMSAFKNHDVQSVNLQTTTEKAFDYIANPNNLPNWTGAFRQADEKSALLITPNGELKIGLKTKTNKESGAIDWYMTMPDGSVGVAYSRVVAGPDKKAIYSFVLIAPPVPLEQIEGTLAAQIGQLKEELEKLKTILAD